MAEISDASLLKLSQAIASHVGLHYPKERLRDLKRALAKAASRLGFEDTPSCLQWLMDSGPGQHQIEGLADFLTIGETHFFRDEKLFQILEGQILPELISSRRMTGRRLRIWSAGCASGEEPYSVAMVLHKILPDLACWEAAILATDINRSFLEKASVGRYTQWSFRTVPRGVQERYFRQNRHHYEIVQDIKNMVSFAYLNLAKDVYPIAATGTDAMDLIFCRNVLMYLTPQRQTQVVENLCRSLADGGWLAVSPAEAPLVAHPGMVAVNFPGAVLYRKEPTEATSIISIRFNIPTKATAVSSETPAFTTRDLLQEATDSPPFRVDFAESRPDTSVAWEEPSGPQQRTSAGRTAGQKPPRREPEQPLQAAVPREEMSLYVEGLALFEQGRYSAAVDKLLTVLDRDHLKDSESGTATALLAKAYANQGKLEEALVWSERAAQVDKLNADYHYLHATILQEHGRLEEAVAALRRAVFLDPAHVVAHFSLGNLARLTGKRQEAGRHFRSALDALGRFCEDDPVPASEGMNAGRFKEMILAMTAKESLHERQ